MNYALSACASAEDLMRTFELATVALAPPHQTITPQHTMPVIRSREGARHADLMRWGWVEGAAPDASFAQAVVHTDRLAHREGIQNAARSRRCLVPVGGFYGRRMTGQGPQACYVSLPSQPLMALAGLWELWIAPQGTARYTFCVLTVPPPQGPDLALDWMPLVLPPTCWRSWLDTEPRRLETLATFLNSPIPDGLYYRPG